MFDYRDRLVAAVKSGDAVLVLGTGVSKAITNGASQADWVGLIRDGITAAGGSANWVASQEMSLDLALSESDLDSLLGVASRIAAKLKGQSPQAYSDWLRDSIGMLRPYDPALARALERLKLPILTTNYDRLIEDSLGWESVTWTNPDAMRRVFKLESKAVGHLHGIYTDADSVIFSEADYERLKANDNAQFIQQAYYATKSFIYVGFGGGLHDPNFKRLLDRHSSMFPQSNGDHFRLCLDSERTELEFAHISQDIRVISYGSHHGELVGFIEELAEGVSGDVEIATRDRLSFAREAIVDAIRADTVVGATLDDIDECELSDITVPPVLLPVPHDQYASMQELDEELRPKRVDASGSYVGNKLLILVGDELSGVSTALRWLVSNAAFARPGAAPIFVDARNCVGTRAPLENQIRRECLNHRVIDSKRSELPEYVLAVDNLAPYEAPTYYQMIEEIRSCSAGFVALGVRTGDEQRISQDLGPHPLPVEIIYLGKLGKAEIALLAGMVAPKRREFIASGVLDALRREHLPRNPFTVSLLISLFAQLGEASKHSSETAVLDDYVSLLLGRNGPYLDARYSLDPQNRETVLADLAKAFVRRRKGALSQDDALKTIAGYFKSVSWKEDPFRVLESFREIRVLRVTHGVVQFQQSSYLHLFAAKAAIRDPKFLSELLDEPVFFAPIVRHYAALVRNSEQVILRIEELLSALPVESPKGKIYGRIEKRAAPPELGRLFDGPEPEEGPSHGHDDALDGESDAERDVEEEYDVSDDTDMVPFPLEDQSRLSPSTRMLRATDLASRVLRDSDQLENLDLKVSVLKSALVAWGAALDYLESEEVFEEHARMIVDGVLDEGGIKPDKAEELVGKIAMFIPSFVIYSGISACLSSRKLLLTFEEVLADENFLSGEYGLPMAAMFAFDVQENGWAKILPILAAHHGNRWIVSEFIGMLATLTFRHSELASTDESDVKGFLRERASQRFNFDSEVDRRNRLAKYVQDIVRERALNRRGRSPLGTSVLDRGIEA